MRQPNALYAILNENSHATDLNIVNRCTALVCSFDGFLVAEWRTDSGFRARF